MTLIVKSFLLIAIFLNPFSFFSEAFKIQNETFKFSEIGRKASVPTEKQRKQVLKKMEQVMGKLPSRSKLVPLDIKIIDSVRESSLTRYNLTFSVAKNERISAYLYVPHQGTVTKKNAAMVVLHGTDPLGKGVVDGQGGKPNRAHARELAERGYVVIAPDYPSFGDMKEYNFETDRYESATMQGIFNHMRCVDLLQSRTDVDPDKIGVAGLSLGGHNSMFVAAFDERIKVAVSASGWTQFEYYNIGDDAIKRYGGRLGPWAQTRYMPLFKTKYNLDGDKIPFNFDDVISAIAPRAFFSVSPINDANFDVKGVKAGIELAKKTYAEYDAEDMLQVRYPDAGHDFPVLNRKEAYAFIDKVLGHIPRIAEIN
ncbi:alpha/beta hydrolase [Daejeonella lutea]|uniref:Alpha/beta hydrolase family protein n=1 Tax=Daejeonella lutea TaxID=572036 RepID=A0A1T5A7H3_9SPHI|nr:alpha/beta fold hydrolase [Daejeonella lutea]SKB30677.1 Alpha/beta hydrolase family protein [Daejeonella lutea]